MRNDVSRCCCMKTSVENFSLTRKPSYTLSWEMLKNEIQHKAGNFIWILKYLH